MLNRFRRFIERLSFCQCHKLSGGHRPSWFELLLMRLIPHFDIVKTIDVEAWRAVEQLDGCFQSMPVMEKRTVLYLRRFYIWRSKWIGKNWGDIYLHHIVRSDDDKDPHDHPWSFTGLILKGGYTDEQWRGFWNEDQYLRCGPTLEKVRPLSIIRRKATHIHRVLVPEGKTAWTLILTKGYDRPWFFVTENGPVFWRDYLGIPAGVDVGE